MKVKRTIEGSSHAGFCHDGVPNAMKWAYRLCRIGCSKCFAIVREFEGGIGRLRLVALLRPNHEHAFQRFLHRNLEMHFRASILHEER